MDDFLSRSDFDSGVQTQYYARLMSAPCVVDSVEFARKGATHAGDVAIESMQRLSDVLFDSSGRLAYSLQGFVSDQGEPSLRLQIRGKLVLVCQRCLGALPFEVSTQRVFVLSGPEEDHAEGADETEELERIPADPKLDVLALVEDELILGLPMAPVHGPRDCEAGLAATNVKDAVSPFSALAALKQPKV